MVRLGIPRPPGVALGDRVVHGWNPDGYAALLGVTYRAAKRFSPAELASRLDRVLESAQGLIARFDARQMDHVPPERKRTLRDLAFHVFRLSLGFVDAVDRAELPESVYEERAHPELVSGGDVARYGALVRARLRDRKSTRLNSSHVAISYAVFCLKKKKKRRQEQSSEYE